MIVSHTGVINGSPPRAWGQSSGRARPALARRFTPTGVGTITVSRLRSRPTAVHPHGRGDNISRRWSSVSSGGSPPRAWGQLMNTLSSLFQTRFTPTGVGTIQVSFEISPHVAVHPHGRGDNVEKPRQRLDRLGSPPRAWGQSSGRARPALARRFTPTGVGTISERQTARPIDAVHPHGRGDNPLAVYNSVSASGSPPRAWGQFRA